tara:strand:- start:75 stop:398 length:324 start_codon:yes stop_codon:yes gene_type:complete
LGGVGRGPLCDLTFSFSFSFSFLFAQEHLLAIWELSATSEILLPSTALDANSGTPDLLDMCAHLNGGGTYVARDRFEDQQITFKTTLDELKQVYVLLWYKQLLWCFD